MEYQTQKFSILNGTFLDAQMAVLKYAVDNDHEVTATLRNGVKVQLSIHVGPCITDLDGEVFETWNEHNRIAIANASPIETSAHDIVRVMIRKPVTKGTTP